MSFDFDRLEGEDLRLAFQINNKLGADDDLWGSRTRRTLVEQVIADIEYAIDLPVDDDYALRSYTVY